MKSTLLTLALLTLASCSHTEQALDPKLEGFFPEDIGEVRKTDQFIEVSAAAGARNDAMLSRQHFDGTRLNSLGEQKLDYMLKDDDAPSPMTVYLNVDEKDVRSNARKAAIVTFLQDKGLAPADITVIYGDNAATRSPASAHLTRLMKTETGEAGGGGSSGGKDSGGAAPAADSGAAAAGASDTGGTK